MGCPSVREMRRGNFILLIYNTLQFCIKISIKIICINIQGTSSQKCMGKSRTHLDPTLT